MRSAGVAAAVAGVLAGGAVAPEQPLMEAGLDSLGALELRNALQARFGVNLAATAMFDFPTAAALAAHVHAALAPGEVRGITGHIRTWTHVESPAMLAPAHCSCMLTAHQCAKPCACQVLARLVYLRSCSTGKGLRRAPL